jgi:hypothetical protein
MKTIALAIDASPAAAAHAKAGVAAPYYDGCNASSLSGVVVVPTTTTMPPLSPTKKDYDNDNDNNQPGTMVTSDGDERRYMMQLQLGSGWGGKRKRVLQLRRQGLLVLVLDYHTLN